MSYGDIDPAFSGLSHKPGLEVWRISTGYTLKKLDQSEHGKFYTGDAYIVLKVTALKSGGIVFAIHYWLGKGASKTDAKIAASKSMDLDAALGTKATSLLREAQGHESDLFLSYFRPCVIPIPGAQGKADPQASGGTPQLWQVKGRRFVHVRQVPFARSSLAHSDVLILNNGGKKVYQFNGGSSDKQERCRGLQVLQAVRAAAGGARIPYAIIEDNDMTTAEAIEFWDLFGGFAPIQKKTLLEDDAEAKAFPPVLSWVSANGAAEMARGAELSKKLLEASRCLIVDTGPKLYVWKGRTSTLEDRRAAAVASEIILASGSRPPATLVVYLNERGEIGAFKDLFPDWQGAKGATEGGASSKFKAVALSAWYTTTQVKGIGGAGHKSEPPQPLVPDVPTDVKVWRLNGKERHLLGQEETGVFYSGDCYLVQASFVRERKAEFVLFFWIGKHSTPEERTAGAAAAERTADTRGGHVTLVRVVQGKEPEQFFSIMKRNLFFFLGGLSNSYKAQAAKQGGDDTFDPAKHGLITLFAVKPRDDGHFMATQMPLTAKSLNSSECFILLTNSNPILWTGARSGDKELQAAVAAAEALRPGVQVRKLAEGRETTVFWGHLGGRLDYPAAPEIRDGPRELRLFHVLSPTSNPLKVKEVPGFTQDDLTSEDVLILDSFQEVFLWVGSAVSDADKREAFPAALKYMDIVAQAESRSKDTTVIRVWEGYEVPMFTGLFGKWEPARLGIFLDPYQRFLALLEGKTMEELEAERKKQLASQPATDSASQRAAAFAALQGSLGGDAGAKSDDSAGGGKSKPAPPGASTQRQAALAALSASLELPSPAEKGKAAASAAGALTPITATVSEDAAALSASSQRRAALAALQGSLQGESEAKDSKAKPKVVPPPVAGQHPNGAEDKSPGSQRAAAVAALQGTLKDEKLTKSVSSVAKVAPAVPAAPEDGSAQVTPTKAADASGQITYTLSQLQINSADPAPGIDTTKRESYLSDSEFVHVFQVTKDQFYATPKWKQDQRKRSVGLY